ncbi:MAG: branched-chain amino acid aminotransferase [Saprospirales bacterium]|nr:MAG: branched-chain amino acid aminotransferase [Saprospirales bacterium]
MSKIKTIAVENSSLDNVDFNNIPFGRVFSDHMFSAVYRNGEWQDLKICPTENINVHPAMMALHYGQSIFEGMKATVDQSGIPLLFRPEKHIERLNASARRMCMPEIPTDIFLEAIHRLVDFDKAWIPPQEGSALYIRPFVFATDEYIGVTASQNYRFLILTLPVGPYYSKPVSLMVERKYVRAVKGGVGEAKTCGNYAASLLPAKLAKEKGFDQVMWMDAHEFKYIQEVGTMNLFFVFKDRIVTPSTDGAILKGITRMSIIDYLKGEGHKVEEYPLTIDEVKEAYKKGELIEAFGSGTAAVIANISRIKDTDIDMQFDASHWKLSTEVKSFFNGVRIGKVPDKYGWIVPVNSQGN